MVDALVSLAVGRLSDLLIQETDFLVGVQDEVVWIRNELWWMQSFLKDAEEKQDSDERIRLWITEIRDIAFSTQDVMDTFYLETKGTGATSKLGLVSTSVKKCFGISGQTDLRNIGKEIEALKKRLLDISRKRESYGITTICDVQEGTSGAITNRLHQLRRTTSYSDEEHVVGIEDDISLLEEKLLNEEPQRSVISILGMGGLGKTTLARKLYNNSYIKYKFSYHAWVYVSQDWNIRNLLERIIKSFKRLSKDELEEMSDEDIERHLREFLKERRYLMVIDDVWHIEVWESLRRAFPDNKKGSRIIFTTRIKAVAEILDRGTYVHELQLLRADESWELFCKKAFPDDIGDANGDRYHCPPDMELLGREMVSKCDGLPLAIIVLGGLLSRKQANQWHAVKEHIWKELKNKSIHISSLLDLSYKDLPHQVKPCFLYLGLFPADSVINVENIVSLWVAEEFIPQGEEGMDLEEVAEEFLKELIDRSLIQVVTSNWRITAECRVHDLLRDLAIKMARKQNFRHHSQFQRCALVDHSNPDVSTLLSSNQEGMQTGLLRVLDLEGTQFYTEGKLRFAEAVGKLLHLRYLGLKDTDIDELPNSMGKLQLLQTLETSSYTRLPRKICKLKQLRHLRGYFSVPLLLLAELTGLRTIKVVQVGNQHQPNKKEVGDNFALIPIATLTNLKYLSVWSFTGMLLVKPLYCRHLIELRILGKIGDLAEEMPKSLPNLQYLALCDSNLKKDPMPTLELFPRLIGLELSYTNVKHLKCTAYGFPQLEFFRLVDKIVLKMEVHEKAMPRLRALSMHDSEREFLPERLKSLHVSVDLNRGTEHFFSTKQENSQRRQTPSK